MAKILVIDDNEELRKMLAKMLGRAGHVVVAAENGKQGIDLYHKALPDLVITDVIMPDMDGVEVVAELRKMAPEIKVILMSGGGQGGSGSEYLESINTVMNVPHIIVKPFEKEDLLKMIKDVLG